MSTLLYILIAILILGVLIIVHEMGHFWVGRWLGFKILEFGIGFGPKLVHWERKEIRYSIRLIPLGGFVSFYGEDEDNPDDPRAMNNMPWWKRSLTLLAGPGANILFALLVAFVLFFTSGYTTPMIQEINENAPLAQTEAQVGDHIIAVNGETITTSDAFEAMLEQAKETGEPVLLTLRRGQETVEITTDFYQETQRSLGITVRSENGGRPVVESVQEESPLFSVLQKGDVIAKLNGVEVATPEGLSAAAAALPEDALSLTIIRDGKSMEVESTAMSKQVWRLGIVMQYLPRSMPIGTAAVESLKADWELSKQILGFLWQLITGRADLSGVSGPVGTISQMSTMVSVGAKAGGAVLLGIILNLMWAISLNLAIFNLLPIPALDGARIVFTLIEGIRRKPIKRELEAKIHAIGFIVLIAFVIFIEIRNAFFAG